MRNRTSITAFMALMLLGQTGACFGADSIPTTLGAGGAPALVALTVVAPIPATRKGVLYRVRNKEQRSYLFGTVHVGTSAFYPLGSEVSSALADCTTLAVELDTRQDAAYQLALRAHASYQRDDSIARHLPPETTALLIAALHAEGITLASVAHLKPWLLANMLLGLELQRHGYERKHGVETYLLSHAQARGTPVAELESADSQLGLFDTLSDADGERYLRESLRGLSDGSSFKKAKNLIDVWSTGQAFAVDELIKEATEGDAMVADFTRRSLLDRRNPEMAARIAQLMEDGQVAFVGVGVLHLLGANGLPQLLSQRGYQVERIY